MRLGFDNASYISQQAQSIKKRIDLFGDKLYLEFGGKLFDDYHASRVLPGFEPDAKIHMLKSLKDVVEIIIVINANHIEQGKMRSDIGIAYEDDCLRLIDSFSELGLYVGGICITHMAGQPHAEHFRQRLIDAGISVWRHYVIDGYPADIDTIVSDEGFGKNEYIETSRPLVVVTAPGPGSGKLATCLSQLYHDYKRGIKAGYAKYETFPVWNLPLKHPVNMAYEAATADLDDRNIIDPFHLEAYQTPTINYNRDVETFPVLKAILDKIMGTSCYQSPTDMGVNMVGFAISDDEACQTAAKHEIVRRYFAAAEAAYKDSQGRHALEKIKLLMRQLDISPDFSPAHQAALEREHITQGPAAAMVLPDGHMVYGKTSELMGPAAALLINAAKHLAGIDKDAYVMSASALEPICKLKTQHLRCHNPRLHSDEILIALSLSSATHEHAAQAVRALNQLAGCDAYFSVIISEADRSTYRNLGINVCCEAKYERQGFYHR